MSDTARTGQLSGSADRDVLVIFTMDVEPSTRADGHTSGPATTAEGARRVREYADLLREHGYAPTYFVHPELGEEQADLFLELRERGAEVGLHLHRSDRNTGASVPHHTRHDSA